MPEENLSTLFVIFNTLSVKIFFVGMFLQVMITQTLFVDQVMQGVGATFEGLNKNNCFMSFLCPHYEKVEYTD